MVRPPALNSQRSPPGRGRLEPHRHRLAHRVGHLRGQGALPDQVVELPLGAAELAGQRLGGAEGVAGGPDGLVGLLGVLGLLGVAARLGGQELVAEERADLGARRREGGGRERGAVGAHVGDVAALVQPLRQPHHLLGAEPELAAAFLLQGGGVEGGLGRAAVALLLQRADREAAPLEPGGQAAGGGLVERAGVGGEDALLVEVLAGGDPPAVHGRERGREGGRGGVAGRDVPVGGRAELHPLPLALDDEPERRRLDAAGRELGADLAPEDRRDLVAIEPVEGAAGLLGVHQAGVDVTRPLDRLEDRLPGDLVEDHAVHRHLGLQLAEQVPGDRLTLAVLVGGEVEGVGGLERGLQLGDHLRLGHLVGEGEVVLHVDAERAGRQVDHVADRGHHLEVGAEVLLDGLGLGGRLDDDQGLGSHGGDG